jgi:predicted aspartyl protease
VLNYISLDGAKSVAKLDTGADRTCVPVQLVDKLGVPCKDKERFTGFDGKEVRLPVYIVSLRVLGREFPELLVAGVLRDHVLLGRDVLNGMLLSLDGPRQWFRLSGPAFWRRALGCW